MRSKRERNLLARRSLCASLIGGTTLSGGAVLAAPLPEPQADQVRDQSEIVTTRSAKNRLPAGFEDLLAMRETQLSVYYLGRNIGVFTVMVGQGSVILPKPDEIVSKIPNLINPKDVARALSGELPSHTAKACGPMPVAGCDQLDTPVAGVIYDADNNRLIVVVAKNQFENRVTETLARLPKADSAPAALLSVSAYASGFGANLQDQSIDLRLVAGNGSTWLELDGRRSDQGASVRTLAINKRFKGRIVSVGLMESNASGLLPPKRLLGVRFSNTLRDLENPELAYDSPIIIELQRQARVEVFSGSVQLLNTSYGAGRMALDTQGFPNGTYDIEIRIDDGLEKRIEHRTFSRQSDMPPMGASQSYVEIGYPRSSYYNSIIEPNQDQIEVKFGHTRRLAHNIGINSHVIVRQNSAFGEIGLRYRLKSSDVALSMGKSTHRESVAQFSFRARRPRWGLFGGLSQTRTCIIDDKNLSPFLRQRDDFWQASLSANLTLKHQNFTFNSYYRNSRRFGTSLTQGLSYERPLTKNGMRLTLDAQRTDRTWQFGLRISSPFGLGRSHYSGNSDLSLRQSEGHLSQSARLGLQGNATYGQNQLSSQLSLESSDDNRLANLGLGFEGSSVGGYVNLSQSNRDPNLHWHMNGRTQLVLTQTGPRLSAQSNAEAGVMIKNMSAKSADLMAHVEGYGQYKVPAGHSVFVRLEPYRRYSVSVHPSDGSALTGDQSRQNFVIFPGNVVGISRSFSRVTTGFAKLLDAAGQPISGAYLKTNMSNSRTDQFGNFQIDLIDSDEQLIVTKAGATICSVVLPQFDTHMPIYKFGALVCKK